MDYRRTPQKRVLVGLVDTKVCGGLPLLDPNSLSKIYFTCWAKSFQWMNSGSNFFFHFLYSYDTWVHSNDVDAEVEDPPIPEKPWKVKDPFLKNVFLHNLTTLFTSSPQCFLRRYRIMIFLVILLRVVQWPWRPHYLGPRWNVYSDIRGDLKARLIVIWDRVWGVESNITDGVI